MLYTIYDILYTLHLILYTMYCIRYSRVSRYEMSVWVNRVSPRGGVWGHLGGTAARKRPIVVLLSFLVLVVGSSSSSNSSSEEVCDGCAHACTRTHAHAPFLAFAWQTKLFES